MKSKGFVPSESDPCLYIHKEHQVFVLQYVDDQIWIAKDPKHLDSHVELLKRKGFLLTMEDDGDMFGFLRIDIKRDGNKVQQ